MYSKEEFSSEENGKSFTLQGSKEERILSFELNNNKRDNRKGWNEQVRERELLRRQLSLVIQKMPSSVIVNSSYLTFSIDFELIKDEDIQLGSFIDRKLKTLPSSSLQWQFYAIVSFEKNEEKLSITTSS
ncbi:hypothetical protein PVAND_011258 [Polypedilum vanderplanki]|uniref:Uncharacterized protein n=1 Tax=Polypedilum vanderplanki TaxID=319348 RepID=A0A9J6CI05_POLVA|nr:hypothetical protein PVAND_011258 [Polypedilum vanderplanki]